MVKPRVSFEWWLTSRGESDVQAVKKNEDTSLLLGKNKTIVYVMLGHLLQPHHWKKMSSLQVILNIIILWTLLYLESLVFLTIHSSKLMPLLRAHPSRKWSWEGDSGAEAAKIASLPHTNDGTQHQNTSLLPGLRVCPLSPIFWLVN